MISWKHFLKHFNQTDGLIVTVSRGTGWVNKLKLVNGKIWPKPIHSAVNLRLSFLLINLKTIVTKYSQNSPYKSDILLFGHTNKLYYTHSCIRAVISVLNNSSAVKLHGSRVSALSLSLLRVDGWREKVNFSWELFIMLQAIRTQTDKWDGMRCSQEAFKERQLKLWLTHFTRELDPGGDWSAQNWGMRGRCPGTIWSPLIMTVSIYILICLGLNVPFSLSLVSLESYILQ